MLHKCLQIVQVIVQNIYNYSWLGMFELLYNFGYLNIYFKYVSNACAQHIRKH